VRRQIDLALRGACQAPRNSLSCFPGFRRRARILGEAVRLELQLTSEAPFALADIGMLEQVLLNLAVNARDAMPGGGKITLGTAIQEVTSATAREPRTLTPGASHS